MASDPLDDLIASAARVLDLAIAPEWLPSIKSNLDVTLKHAASVAEFELSDEAEPASVFKA